MAFYRNNFYKLPNWLIVELELFCKPVNAISYHLFVRRISFFSNTAMFTSLGMDLLF